MRALVTGASSGIGKEISYCLAKRGIDLCLVARRKERLLELKESLKTNVEILCLDVRKNEDIEKI